ncbi:MAG: phosphoglycerate mutase family protein, partial [Chloroflexi bacterium]|nr:phosphoglycerate mutase family protein [Chloroflexota bacterium]
MRASLMSNLILVRHSESQVDPSHPAREWRLTVEGRRRCVRLAEQLAHYRPEIIVTSVEPKAIETGKMAADHLDIPYHTAQGLHEHERSQVRFLGNDAFLEAVTNLFARPAELVFGDETADQAEERFTQAVKSVIAAYPHKNIAIVTHGTVMSLFVGRVT